MYKRQVLEESIVEDNIKNIKQVVFEVTDSCNLSCTYCAFGELYDGYDAVSYTHLILYAELSQRYEMMRDTLDQIEVTNTIRGRQVLYDEQDKQKALAEERVKTANANLRMVVTSLICLLIVLPTTYLLFKYKKRQKDVYKRQERKHHAFIPSG